MIRGVSNKDLRDSLRFPHRRLVPSEAKRRSRALISRKLRVLRAHGILP